MSGIPTGVSSTASWTPDILDIAQEAAERAGIDNTAGYALQSAQRSLNLLSLEWANEGLNLWTLEQLTVALGPYVGQQPPFPLPADTTDVVYPVFRVQPNGSSNYTDFPLNRFDVTDYAAQPNKQYAGRPTQIFIQRSIIPQFYFDKVLDSNATYTLVYWRLRRMKDATNATNAIDVPYRFLPAIVAGLAWRMAQKNKVQDYNRLDRLKADYDGVFMKAKYGDVDSSSIYLTPQMDW